MEIENKQYSVSNIVDNVNRLPKSFSESNNEIMSNFDGQINLKTAEEIKGKDLFSRYAGWNFNGKVWWQNNKWLCEIWCYQSFRETFVCDTLKEMMEEISSEYGYK